MEILIDKEKENKIIRIIEKGFECGFSKADKIIDIMYTLFPDVGLVFDDEEFEQSEKIYDIYADKIIKGEI